MAGETNYGGWTKAGLIQRVRELEAELSARPAPAAAAAAAAAAPGSAAAPKPAKAAKGKRKMDPSRYATRFVALKLAYLGKNYGGFEFQAVGSLPTIEEELWKALTKACLIFPDDERVVQWDCCEYSKCGRTDRGVSAFGQVVGLRLRSNRSLPKKRARLEAGEAGEDGDGGEAGGEHGEGEAQGEARRDFDDATDELCYPRILNRLLPKDIRVLAWCPSPPSGFSARFSCRERQYRYFFTQPAFAPEPSSRAGWLDIDAMRQAAKHFEGEHDFRNLCKTDPAKLTTNFCRRIFEADIVKVADAGAALPFVRQPGQPSLYYLHVRGSAFLWHQIRHMVALLFLVGQGLEAPDLVPRLLDVAACPRRPAYTMADEVPLVLWDCVFPDLAAGDGARADALPWIYVGDEHAASKHGQFGLVDGLWELWRERKMDELLAAQLLGLVAQQGTPPPPAPLPPAGRAAAAAAASARVYEGGNAGRLAGRYVPVMDRELLQSPEEQNDKHARRKGFAGADSMRAQRAAAAAAKGGAEAGAEPSPPRTSRGSVM